MAEPIATITAATARAIYDDPVQNSVEYTPPWPGSHGELIVNGQRFAVVDSPACERRYPFSLTWRGRLRDLAALPMTWAAIALTLLAAALVWHAWEGS